MAECVPHTTNLLMARAKVASRMSGSVLRTMLIRRGRVLPLGSVSWGFCTSCGLHVVVFHRYPDTDTQMKIHTDTQKSNRYQIPIPKIHTDTDT